MKKLFLLSILLSALYGCSFNNLNDEAAEAATRLKIATHIDVRSARKGDTLTVDFNVSGQMKNFTSTIDESGKNVVVRTEDISVYIIKNELASPLAEVQPWLDADSNYMVKMRLNLKCSMTRVDTDKGFRLIFKLLEPDREYDAMQAFGTWQQSYAAATRLAGIKNKASSTEMTFDGTPVYSTGNNGNADYMDIYGVRIPAGNIKYDGVVSSDVAGGKTRLIFKGNASFCIDGTHMTLGKNCGGGYISLFGVTKRKDNKGNEKFMFRLTGRPEITVKTITGVTGLGMKNVRLFGTGLVRYDGDAVFKTEVRRSGGLTWIVFVHDPAYKFRRFYSSGDVLNVVFYKG
ncbi:hypothetical protein [Seleniivibrio sp.]|uniref:hypothetical protein n=1 Tax=Seleniivibrio sp. TaxID=2898801 RepID=UPI0025CE8CC0|nr:hypothetical protein [Seleniivibrio sp.]MCD8553686.1 hypothetical protein [Seleniivibrio sp.]